MDALRTDQDHPISLRSNVSLPTEILILIITHLTRLTTFGTIFIDGNSLLAFSLVSRHWRISAVSLTIAWRDLDVAWPRDRLQLWISRAGAHPLRCCFNDENEHSYPHLVLNLRSIARLGLPIQLVSFTVSEPRLVSIILGALEAGLSERVGIEIDCSSPSSFDVFIPDEVLMRVDVLALCKVRDLAHFKAPLPRLQSLHLCNRPLDRPFPRILHFAPSLVRLTLSDQPSREFVQKARMLRPLFSVFAEGSPPLLRLETLYVGAPGWAALVLAQEVGLPRLRNLVLGDPSPHVGTVLQLSRECTKIRSLRVNSQHASSILDALFLVPSDLGDPASSTLDTLLLFPALAELQISSIPHPFDIYDTSNNAERSANTEKLKSLRTLLRSEGGLHCFLTERARAGHARLARLHIQACPIGNEDLAVVADAMAWLSEGAEEVTIDLSPAWDIVESADKE